MTLMVTAQPFLKKGKGLKSNWPISLLSVPEPGLCTCSSCSHKPTSGTVLLLTAIGIHCKMIYNWSTIDAIFLALWLLSEIHREFDHPLVTPYVDIKAAFDSTPGPHLQACSRSSKKWTNQLRNNNTPVALFGDMQSTTAILEQCYDFRWSSDNDWLNLFEMMIVSKMLKLFGRQTWLYVQNELQWKNLICLMIQFGNSFMYFLKWKSKWQLQSVLRSADFNNNFFKQYNDNAQKLLIKKCYWKTFECKMVWGHNTAQRHRINQ